MSGTAIFVMTIGIVIIWGGFGASIWYAMKKREQ
jgi:hypothetical protein